MEIKTTISQLFDIQLPIIQGGMVWVSGWKLASAVSNSGCLGLLGAGSMKAELLREHILKCRKVTNKPFGVNIPLLREDSAELIRVVNEENVKIVFTSAGNPAKYIDILKKNDVKVAHVVSSLKFALKAQAAGCDAVVGEGVEAGGHNGIEEITTMCLIPNLAANLRIPVIAAGGISTGSQVLAALSLGAQGVQIGTRFAATKESSAHLNFKQAIIDSKEDGTVLAFKKIALVRAIKNEFSKLALFDEFEKCKSINEMKELLGNKREKLGVFEGNIAEGILDAGQSSVLINDIPNVKDLIDNIVKEIESSYQSLISLFSK